MSAKKNVSGYVNLVWVDGSVIQHRKYSSGYDRKTIIFEWKTRYRDKYRKCAIHICPDVSEKETRIRHKGKYDNIPVYDYK